MVDRRIQILGTVCHVGVDSAWHLRTTIYQPPSTTHHPAMRHVTSRQNPIVRTFRALAETTDPSGARLLLDGAHLIDEAQRAGLTFETAAILASRVEGDTEEGQIARDLDRRGIDVVIAREQVFAAISPVRSPSGIVAIAGRAPTTAAAVCRGTHAFVVGAVDVQDPGNMGAIVRVAEAGGATGVLGAGISASPFSWKAVRGSMGSVLRLPVAAGMEAEAALACMTDAGLRTVAAVPRGGLAPDGIDWTGSVGLLVGGEGPGLSDALVDRCDARVTIPMSPPVESLNVAVAAAILVYAARRQRL
jgi:TrmH family RNA methyltransferase